MSKSIEARIRVDELVENLVTFVLICVMLFSFYLRFVFFFLEVCINLFVGM